MPEPSVRLVAVVGAAPAALTTAPGRDTSSLALLERGDRELVLVATREGALGLSEGEALIASTAPGILIRGRWTRFALVESGNGLGILTENLPSEPSPTDWSITPIGGRPGEGADDGGFRGEIRLGSDAPVSGSPFDEVAWLAGGLRAGADVPRFHYRPPAMWMNEPHGLVEVEGRFHIFHQSNRRSASWHAIEWGHASSDDLVHWHHHAPAFTPDADGPMPTGAWSGSVTHDDEGAATAFITAGNATRDPDQSVIVAHALDRDLLHWQVESGPLFEAPREAGGRPLINGQFRDPYAWRSGGGWFCLVGSGTSDRVGGAALLYRSEDGLNWGSPTIVHSASLADFPDLGQMWELPVLLPLSGPEGDAHALFVCPWWAHVPEGRTVQVWYWIGDFDPDDGRFRPRHEEPRRFDHGYHFTGPSGARISDGRSILFSIAQDGRDDSTHLAEGWAHNAGLPLELGLDSGELTIAPVRELESLRRNRINGQPDVVIEALHAEIRASATGRITLSCRSDDLLLIELALEFREERWQLRCRRPGADEFDTWHPVVEETAVLRADSPVLDLRLFVDGGMIELYAGKHDSFTTRIRPDRPMTIATDGADSAAGWHLTPA